SARAPPTTEGARSASRPRFPSAGVSSMIRPRRGSMTRTIPLLLVLAAASIGCAEITYDSRELRRTVLHTDRTLTPSSARATFRQHGSLVEGEAERICDVS